MRGTWTIATREFASFFATPLGWVAMALYLAIAGLVFGYGVVVPGGVASLRDVFALSGFLLLPVVPAITMRLVSEELKSGTIEPLMTSPVSDAAIVAGKFLGAGMFLLAVVMPTVIHAAVLWLVSDPRPDVGPMVAGYLSLVLLGGLYAAVGVFVSTLTSNPTLAYLGTFVAILVVLLIGAEAVPMPRGVAEVVRAVSLRPRLADFAKGVVDSRHVVFFVSVTAWVLVLALVSLESRRWR
jgi:ABC-2 type transport system permease protein